ncbi:MAG TPA: carboxypeptidase-like regulatory domain-containing protein, partial [Thermoanaerobaculia bacterium]|nr:carboxypeptidase-like regulatory domain-containing protein [Thermoanaerobaculia bacterium]
MVARPTSARPLFLGFLIFLVAFPLLAADGHIQGRITRTDGSPIGGVIVQITELSHATLTDSTGSFSFDRVAPGNYTLQYTAGTQVTSDPVEVTSGNTTQVDKKVDWKLSVAETITVYSASRHTERVT